MLTSAASSSGGQRYPLKKGKGLDAMERELTDRLGECKKYINATYDVGGLCSSYAGRMEDPPRNRARRPSPVDRSRASGECGVA